MQCGVLTEKLEEAQDTIKRLEQELEIAKRSYEVAVKERDYERAVASVRPSGLLAGATKIWWE